MGFPLNAQGGVASAVVEEVESAIAAALQDTDPLRRLQARLFSAGPSAVDCPPTRPLGWRANEAPDTGWAALSPGSVIP